MQDLGEGWYEGFARNPKFAPNYAPVARRGPSAHRIRFEPPGGSGKTMADLLADVTLFPQTLINVRLQPGVDWKANTRLTSETQAVEAELGDTGRVLIRASGTEPLVRVMVEARDAKQAQACAERLAATLR